ARPASGEWAVLTGAWTAARPAGRSPVPRPRGEYPPVHPGTTTIVRPAPAEDPRLTAAYGFPRPTGPRGSGPDALAAGHA
ncbi:serine/threonine protein kinase, partial [Streptomyces sp. SID1046]|nr:serine/threonine protein kinase [Streptomyces sp. SID1046]